MKKSTLLILSVFSFLSVIGFVVGLIFLLIDKNYIMIPLLCFSFYFLFMIIFKLIKKTIVKTDTESNIMNKLKKFFAK